MKYRRRGGFNERVPIIRPPHYQNNHHAQATSPTKLDTPTSEMATLQPQEVATSTQQIGASNSEGTTNHIPDVNRSDQVLETSTTNLHNVIPENEGATIPDQTGNPEKEDLVLDPNGLWFTHCAVVDVISETSYKSYFKGLYYNWNMTPPEVKQRWWNAFKEKKLNRKPTASELYYDTHVDNEGHFVNAKEKDVWNEYEKRKTRNLQYEAEHQKTDDQIFYNATGGWSDKGRIFGLGAAAHSYFETSEFDEGGKAKKSRRDYIIKWENQVDDLIAENMVQKKELDATKEGLADTQKKLAKTEDTLDETTTSLKNPEKQVEFLMKINQANSGSLFPTS
ncbi:Acireductone dioxygenase [Bienertia sinuspersici]